MRKNKEGYLPKTDASVELGDRDRTPALEHEIIELRAVLTAVRGLWDEIDMPTNEERTDDDYEDWMTKITALLNSKTKIASVTEMVVQHKTKGNTGWTTMTVPVYAKDGDRIMVVTLAKEKP